MPKSLSLTHTHMHARAQIWRNQQTEYDDLLLIEFIIKLPWYLMQTEVAILLETASGKNSNF